MKDLGLNNPELTYDSDFEDDNASGCENDDSSKINGVSISETTVKSVQKLFREQDQLFHSILESIKNKLWAAIQTDTVERLIKDISENDHVRTVTDHLGRSLLHAAVEQQNFKLVECLLHSGVNQNLKEACGITPLLIAVIMKKKDICQICARAIVYWCSKSACCCIANGGS